jgi:hypothetical protein
MRTASCLAFAVLAAVSTFAWAQKPVAYPAKNQDATQQTNDDAQCLAWSKQTTGTHGERMAGALRGAAGGAVIGEIANGDSSKGAGVGATAGVLAGGARARRNHAAQAQQAQAAQAQTMNTYYRAYGACMQGRGYTVN